MRQSGNTKESPWIVRIRELEAENERLRQAFKLAVPDLGARAEFYRRAGLFIEGQGRMDDGVFA